MNPETPVHPPKRSYKDNLKCSGCDAEPNQETLDRVFQYDDRWDSWICSKHNQFLEKTCSDQDCVFCTSRPERPYSHSYVRKSQS